MNHTPQIKSAIQFAAKKHHGQLRHGREPLPYVTHLFSVALLVAESGAHDDVVIAALLHDTLEDTETTREEIAAAFGEHVAKLIEWVSEDKSLEWAERKAGYLAAMEKAPEEALLIAIADKVDNTESKMQEFEEEGEEFLAAWKQPQSAYLDFNARMLEIAQARMPGHALTKRFAEAHSKEKV